VTKTALWLAVAALVATAGCSVGHRAPAATPSTPTQPTESARSTSRAPGPVRVRPVGVIAVPHSEIGPLALNGHTVVFPFTESGGPDSDSVKLFDADTHIERVVAHTAYPQGLINWAAGSGDWVAWVDQSRRQSDSEPDVLWRVHALDTRTGRQLLLASNEKRPDPFVPQVHGTGDWFYWTQAEPNRTAREQIWTPSWARPRSLLRHTEMTPGSESVVAEQLVYLGPAAARHGAHTVGGDCWAVPLDRTGAPARLTDTALAMGCAVSDTGELVRTAGTRRVGCCTAATSRSGTRSPATVSPPGRTPMVTLFCARSTRPVRCGCPEASMGSPSPPPATPSPT
jgi:hypothetical protein